MVELITNQLQVFKLDRTDKNLHLQKVNQFTLQHDEHILKIENGQVLINVDSRKIRRYIIDEKIFEKMKIKSEIMNHASDHSYEGVSQDDILKMQIEPANVTIQDIKRYEKLMNGKSIKAISNA